MYEVGESGIYTVWNSRKREIVMQQQHNISKNLNLKQKWLKIKLHQLICSS